MFDSEGLVCPLDGHPLRLQSASLQCDQGHQFDLARQGYCHLLPVQDKRSKDPGDSKAMVQARSTFLDSGLYQSIAELLHQQVDALLIPSKVVRIADAGCGEGYYLNELKQRLLADGVESRCIGFDISKWAVQKATRRNAHISWLVASNRQPPIAKDYLDIMLCMFGFPQFEAFAKTIKIGGYLLMLDAGVNHLIELRHQLYDTIKPARIHDACPEQQAGFQQISTCSLTTTIQVKGDLLQHLLLMTPHFFKVSEAVRSKVLALTELELTLDVQCRILKRER